jgi:hypothetical protein
VRLADLLRGGAIENVAVDEDEIGHMAGLERPQPVLGEAGIGAAAGEGGEGLLQRQPLPGKGLGLSTGKSEPKASGT